MLKKERKEKKNPYVKALESGKKLEDFKPEGRRTKI